MVSPFAYVPLALCGLPPPMYLTHRSLNTLFRSLARSCSRGAENAAKT